MDESPLVISDHLLGLARESDFWISIQRLFDALHHGDRGDPFQEWPVDHEGIANLYAFAEWDSLVILYYSFQVNQAGQLIRAVVAFDTPDSFNLG